MHFCCRCRQASDHIHRLGNSHVWLAKILFKKTLLPVLLYVLSANVGAVSLRYRSRKKNVCHWTKSVVKFHEFSQTQISTAICPWHSSDMVFVDSFHVYKITVMGSYYHTNIIHNWFWRTDLLGMFKWREIILMFTLVLITNWLTRQVPLAWNTINVHNWFLWWTDL